MVSIPKNSTKPVYPAGIDSIVLVKNVLTNIEIKISGYG
tara:strand:+ start:352 stop:468 length:117 start_codon:yes stop_codon:yes gene_type:complete